jgi:RNA 2',3'-cyclic 3'-phosphodiesterase
LIRSFLAIELPDTIQTRLGEIEKDLESASADVRWVSPEKIHLTLKFFGSIEEAKIESIMDAIRRPVEETRTFEIRARGTGAFPGLRNPRVVWVGLDDPDGRLRDFQKQLDACLETVGFEAETRDFRPHLTMGRVRSNRGKEGLIAKIEKHREEELGVFRVEKVTLFKSDLRPTGSIYTPLKQMRLVC